jgi:myo-inositol 2-dehydrogenase/D-chiro-inositol 1-dehydrogenase
VFERLEERAGQRVLERYGMTETIMNVSNPYDGERRPGTVGLPLPGVELRLAGGHEGEVLLRGPNVFSGYWENPEATAEAFDPDGWFRTGDLGSFDERGYLRIEGRSKELIITGGYNVHPREVEELLLEHPGVAEAAVVGTPSEEWGEQVTAFVVPADPGAPPDREELLAFAAERLAGSLGAPKATTDPAELLADPAVEAVLIAAPARFHADLVEAAAGAGKAVFCEKPMALTVADADRAIAAAQAAGMPLQVGFNRRFDTGFRAAHDLVAAGRLGTPQLLRSLTRDPGIPDPGRVAPSTIFLETLIHDFDTLRYLNPGAEAVEVYAVADALAYPDYKDQGLQDTAVVLVRFDNGAMATAEASFNAVYGYDIRGEVFGSAGMATAGDIRRTTMVYHGAEGVVADTWRRNIDLFHDAYTAELAAFADCVRSGATPEPGGRDARAALAIALAAIRSVETGSPVRLSVVEQR